MLTRDATPSHMEQILSSKHLDTIARQYYQFYRETESGHQGITAQFWFQYVKLIELFSSTEHVVQTM